MLKKEYGGREDVAADLDAAPTTGARAAADLEAVARVTHRAAGP